MTNGIWIVNEHVFTIQECEDFSQLWFRGKLYFNDSVPEIQIGRIYFFDAFKLEIIDTSSESKDIIITVNNEDVTDSLMYTFDCDQEERFVTFNTTNLENTKYFCFNSSVKQLPLGTFSVPSWLKEFTVFVWGNDLCGDSYFEKVIIDIEKDCCEEMPISVRFECPLSANPFAEPVEPPCYPCDYGNVLIRILDQDGNELTDFKTINITDKNTGVTTQINLTQFAVSFDTSYTITVVMIDEDGKECIYMYDFEYKCCGDFTEPTNLMLRGSTLSWDLVPGAVSYIVESSSDWSTVDCSCKYPSSIGKITTEDTSVSLPPTGKDTCYMVQVRAVCSDGSISEPSSPLCVVVKGKGLQKVFVTPNPSKGAMTFNVLTSDVSQVSIELHDIYGKLVKSFVLNGSPEKMSSVSWDESNFKKGIYFVTFKSNNETRYSKVIVE